MKTLLLCNPSPNQRALANRLHSAVPLSAIALVTPRPGKWQPSFGRKLVDAGLGLPLRRAWFAMQAHYERLYPAWPPVETSRHEGVNAAEVEALVRGLSPDLVIVSGTDLLKQPLIDAANETGRIVNLHTGISPYVKGGPNCTNWCLATGQPELIGNTVMWIDVGIDSGNIIATERTPLGGVRTPTELHIAVMDHAHDLYVRAVARLKDGAALPSVPQSELGKGRLFLTRHWTGLRSLRAWLNFLRMRPLTDRQSGHRLVALDEPDQRGLALRSRGAAPLQAPFEPAER